MKKDRPPIAGLSPIQPSDRGRSSLDIGRSPASRRYLLQKSPRPIAEASDFRTLGLRALKLSGNLGSVQLLAAFPIIDRIGRQQGQEPVGPGVTAKPVASGVVGNQDSRAEFVIDAGSRRVPVR